MKSDYFIPTFSQTKIDEITRKKSVHGTKHFATEDTTRAICQMKTNNIFLLLLKV